MRTRNRLGMALIGVTLLVSTLLAANFSGGIYTSTGSGATVNGNVYPSKDDVYLNGGPQNQSGQGLPDGHYYFQVTNPSGAQLLSTDAIACREVQVVAGVVAGAVGSCPHPDGAFNPANSSTPVKLMPYLDTPNNGGEYKLWLTPVAEYSPTNNGCTFGFCNSSSKTDNFKVQTPAAANVTVCKFNDLNNDGLQNADEPLIPHWPINATGVDGATVDTPVATMTDDTGCVSFTYSGTDASSVVTLTEGTWGPDWQQTAPTPGACGATCSVSVTGVITLTVTKGANVAAPNFGNHNAACAVDPDGCSNLNRIILTKDAYPRYKRTYTWEISKKVGKAVIETASTATANYEVTVEHDGGTNSDVEVVGTIRVANPGSTPIENVIVTDDPGNDGTCSAVEGTNLTIPAGDHVDVDYLCTFDSLPAGSLPALFVNTATAIGTDVPEATATANVDFSTVAPTPVNDSIIVDDTIAGSLGTVTVGDDNPTTFGYKWEFDDPAGTCTTHPNTASFKNKAEDTVAAGSASQSVTVCVGADLKVSKTAVPQFVREYKWTIAKAVDKTFFQQVGGSVTANYSVTAAETGFSDSGWLVTGQITVENPNDWQSITADVTDVINNGGTCVVNGGTGVAIAPSASVTLGYSCSYSAAPAPSAFTNTATAAWDGAAAFTPASKASGTATGTFNTPSSTMGKVVTVTDTFAGTTTTLGTVTATDATPYASSVFTYTRTLPVPRFDCVTYDNTATLKELDQSAGATVKVCGPTRTGALTMGFWQNPNGQRIIKGGAAAAGVCVSGTWLRQFAPYQDLSGTASCSAVATYVTTIIKAANASGSSMNAMLKAQMLATALDVFFSNPALGGNQIGAPAPIGDVAIDLTHINKPIGSTLFEDASSSFGGASTLTVVNMLSYAASRSNVGGIAWYGQVKNGPGSQELAKDAFDAINNQVAFAP